MNLVFLGTGGAVPSVNRNLSSTAIQYGPEVILFDCAEGTQRQFMMSSISFMKVEKVFITHFHGDHFLGLPGLLQSMAFMGRENPISIYGPPGMIKIVQDMVKMGYFARSFDIEVMEMEAGDTADFSDYGVKAVEVQHGVPALGYLFQENQRPGRFNLDRAKELGIPEGPYYRRLQAGETIEVGERIIEPEMVLGPPRRGRKVLLSGDTSPCPSVIEAAREADVLVHECTYASDMAEKAVEYGHSTAEDAARIAKEAAAGALYLTHISNRYDDPSVLEEEARTIFLNSIVAQDLMSVQIRARE